MYIHQLIILLLLYTTTILANDSSYKNILILGSNGNIGSSLKKMLLQSSKKL